MNLRLAYIIGAALLLAAPAQAQLLQLDRTDASRTQLGALTFRGAYVIPSDATKIGGLSALAVQDETHILALTDNAQLYRLTLQWDAQGNLHRVTNGPGTPLLDENGLPPRNRARFDSESLTRTTDGWLVGYERDHRIERYKNMDGVPSGRPTPMPAAPGWASLPRNLGLEAMTHLQDGRVLAFAEAGDANDLHQAWLWQDSNWQTLSYQAAPGLQPSDMALLPNGDVLVLERGFNFLFGFRARLVLVRQADIKAGTTLSGPAWAVLESPVLNENFEGVAVRKMPDGVIRIFIVSDNNFNAAQQTILAVFDTKAVQ